MDIDEIVKRVTDKAESDLLLQPKKNESDEQPPVDETVKPGSETEVKKEVVDDKQPVETSKTDEEVTKANATERQKMEYAFNKQFKRNDARWKSEVEAMRQEIEALKKAQSKPDVKVTRDNFENDDDFEAYKDSEREKRLFEKFEANRIAQQEQTQASTERVSSIKSKVSEIYDNAEDLKLYEQMVKHALENGLEETLANENKDRTTLKFIDNSSIGPRILQHLIGYPEKMEEIMQMDDVLDKKVELKLLERELKNDIAFRKSSKANVVNKTDEPKPKAPIIGKLGTTGSSSQSDGTSHEDIRKMLRGIRYGN